MPRAPKDTDADAPQPDAPIPPGIDTPQPAADPDAAIAAEAAPGEPTEATPPTPAEDPLDERTAGELAELARTRGVLPAAGTGSGSGGRVVRDDLLAALEAGPPDPPAGRPPLVAVAEQLAAQAETTTAVEEE